MNIFQYHKNPLTGDKILDYARQIVAENELLLKDIQESQWDKGEDSKGNIIGRYKSLTEVLSKGKKKKGTRYNLNDKGDLRRSTDVKSKRQDDDIVIITDSSAPHLLDLFDTIQNYGLISNPNTIFGYQKENLKKFREIIKKELKIKAKQNHGVQL